MIHFKIRYNNARLSELTLEGHSDGLKGKDILCAAISAISQSALTGLIYYNKDGIEWKLEKGYINIRIKDLFDEKIQVILTTMVLGIKAISKEFPDKIHIKEIK